MTETPVIGSKYTKFYKSPRLSEAYQKYLEYQTDQKERERLKNLIKVLEHNKE